MTLTDLINIAYASHQTRFAAQHGLFFDSMDEVLAALADAGHQVQQCDGTRVLVNHKAWVTKHGVVYPA